MNLGEPLTRLAPKTFLGKTEKHWASNDLYLDLSFYKEGSSFPSHDHTNAYFSFVLDGTCDEESCLGRSQLCSGHGVFHASGSRHANYWHRSGHCMSLEFQPSFWARFDQEQLPLPASRILSPTSVDLALKIFREMSHLDSASQLVIEAHTLLLLAELLRQPNSEKSQPRWLTMAEEILRAEFTNPPSLTDLANRVGVHPTHLARSFQKWFGKSVGETVRLIRIETARSRLMTTELSVGEISRDLGFCDQSHFNRLFKSETGFTPQEFRRTRTTNVRAVQGC